MADVDLRLDRAAIDDLLNSADGPVGRAVIRSTARIERTAKRICPVDTGRLRSSITRSLGRDSRGLFGEVGSNVEYAVYVELGTSRAQAQPYLRPALAAEVVRLG